MFKGSFLRNVLFGFSHTYLPTLPVFPGVFPGSFSLNLPVLGDFPGLFLDIVFNDILTMQRFLDISRFLYSGDWQVWSQYISKTT